MRMETRLARAEGRQRTGISIAGASAPGGAGSTTTSDSEGGMGAELRAAASLFNGLTSHVSSPPLVPMPRLLRAVLGLITLGAIWGLTPAMAKLAMAEGMRPLGVAAIAAGLSAAALLLVAAARGEWPRWRRANLLHYGAGGMVGLALANLTGFTGLTHAPAGLFALLVPLSALFSVLLFASFGMERLTPRRILGTGFGVAGVALAMMPGAALPDPALLPWAALMLLTPICYAAANLLSVRLSVPGTTALQGAAGTVTGATVSVMIIALPLGHLGLPPSAGIAALLLVQGLLTALAYLLYFGLLASRGGVFTSQVAYLITLAGLLWGYLIFAEVPGPLTLPAAALVFGGVLLVTTERRRNEAGLGATAGAAARPLRGRSDGGHTA
jgi:drug/metabolite transporter (DMT)-like permease